MTTTVISGIKGNEKRWKNSRQGIKCAKMKINMRKRANIGILKEFKQFVEIETAQKSFHFFFSQTHMHVIKCESTQTDFCFFFFFVLFVYSVLAQIQHFHYKRFYIYSSPYANSFLQSPGSFAFDFILR